MTLSARKKLCILVPSHWEALTGGAEYQARLLVERLISLNRFDVHYLTRRIAPRFVPRGYTIHPVATGPRVAGVFFPDAPKLMRVLRALQPDIIYQRVGCAYTGIAAYYAKTAGCRMVWHVASEGDVTRLPWKLSLREPILRIEKKFLEYGVRHADAIVVQTLRQAELLERNYGRTCARRIANFHPPVTASFSKPDDCVRVCWIANMKTIKRPEIFLQVARELRNLPHVQFLMIGHHYPDPDARANIGRMLAELPNVQHLGPQPSAAVNELLGGCHILVNTSDAEGFSNTFIQAWLRDVVVLSLNVNPDHVFDGDKYGMTAGGSIEELRRRLVRLVSDGELRQAIAARARTFAQEVFSMRNIDELVAVLEGDAHPVNTAFADRDRRTA